MEFIETGDGSLTWKDPVTGELYHNRAGAYSEALVNYVRPSGALRRLRRRGEIALIDSCFGLGYNSLVLIQEAVKANLAGRLRIVAIDIDPKTWKALPTVLDNNHFADVSQKLISEIEAHIDAPAITLLFNNLAIELRLQIETLPVAVKRLTEQYDYVYHDPFSPKRVPELWTVDIFHLYHKLLKHRSGAVLTYSAASAVRGGLKEAGFQIAKTESLGAKSGGTIAYVASSQDFLTLPFDTIENSKLMTSSAVPYRDPTFSLDRRSIVHSRQVEQDATRQKD